jgi:hypothetical protein
VAQLFSDGMDLESCVLGMFVFPDPNHGPAVPGETLVGLVIPFDIPRELLRPPRRICAREGRVLWARMPEAPVHEHRQAFLREHDVRPPASVEAEWLLHPEAESAAVEG